MYDLVRTLGSKLKDGTLKDGTRDGILRHRQDRGAYREEVADEAKGGLPIIRLVAKEGKDIEDC